MRSPFSSCLLSTLCAQAVCWRLKRWRYLPCEVWSRELSAEEGGSWPGKQAIAAPSYSSRERCAAPACLGAWGSLCSCSLVILHGRECSLPAPDKTTVLLMQSLLAVAKSADVGPESLPCWVKTTRESAGGEGSGGEKSENKDASLSLSFLPSTHVYWAPALHLILKT